jgi:hypothetical protein
VAGEAIPEEQEDPERDLVRRDRIVGDAGREVGRGEEHDEQ